MKLIDIKAVDVMDLALPKVGWLEPIVVNGVLRTVKIVSAADGGSDIVISVDGPGLRVLVQEPKKKVKRWRVKGQLIGLVYYAKEFHTKELAEEWLAEIKEMISEDWDSGLTIEEFELEVED